MEPIRESDIQFRMDLFTRATSLSYAKINLDLKSLSSECNEVVNEQISLFLKLKSIVRAKI